VATNTKTLGHDEHKDEIATKGVKRSGHKGLFDGPPNAPLKPAAFVPFVTFVATSSL